MKKITFLFALLITNLSFSQVIITELADPENNSNARYVEIYNSGNSSFDLNGFELRRWTNGDPDPQTTGVDLSTIGNLPSGSFAIIAANGTEFAAIYGFTADIDAGAGGAADSNGDDQIAILDNLDNIVDIFGVPGEDGTGTCHEFENGRAERIASASVPESTWNEANWNVWADSAISGCTNHTNAIQNAPADFDPASWIGDANSCGINLSAAVSNCQSSSAGSDNDDVVVEIPYFGLDNTITSVTSSIGTVGGDDPANISDGIITVTGISEGDSWTITINGGNCDGTELSGTVAPNVCDPVTTDLVINEVLADPALDLTGDANGDGVRDGSDDEFIELYNTGTSDIDLSNFIIEDGNGLRHTFPSGTILPSNTFISVFGGGTLTNLTGLLQTASTGGLGLNNAGDDVIIKNASGVVVTLVTYSGVSDQSLGRSPDFTGSFVEHSSIAGNNGALFSPNKENDDSTLSSNVFNEKEFRIYPNPVSNGILNIESSSEEKLNVEFFNMLGQRVLTLNSSTRVNVSNLNTGVYLIKIYQGSSSQTKKIVIQ